MFHKHILLLIPSQEARWSYWRMFMDYVRYIYNFWKAEVENCTWLNGYVYYKQKCIEYINTCSLYIFILSCVYKLEC